MLPDIRRLILKIKLTLNRKHNSMKTHSFITFNRLLFLIFFQISFLSYSQINVVPFNGGKPSSEKDGIIYSLPRSVVKVQLEIIKTDNFKGPYADYAAKLLGLTDVIRDNSTTYEIGSVNLTSYAEADPNQFYFIEIDDKVKDNRSLMVALSEDGFISGFADIGPVKKELKNAMASGDFSNESLKPFRDLLKPVLIEKVDTVIRRISIDTTTVEEKVLKRSISEKTPDQQAREAADLIYRIEDSKFSLITGYQEVNYSRESLEFMLGQLNKMGKEYLALFKGTSGKSIQVLTFYVTPGSSKEGTLETICRFSKTKGITDKSTTTGESVSLVVTPLNQNKAIEDFVRQREQSSKKIHGFYYRIPEKSMVTLRVSGLPVAEEQMLISQMGLVTFLPAGNMSNTRFHPENGSVLNAVSE